MLLLNINRKPYVASSMTSLFLTLSEPVRLRSKVKVTKNFKWCESCMLYTYMPILYYHGNLHVTERAYAGGRAIPLSQRSFLFPFGFNAARGSTLVYVYALLVSPLGFNLLTVWVVV